MKKIAIIFNQPPHGDSQGREALDLALALSDINHISVFFIADGVFHLLPDQQPTEIFMRDYIATFGLLELYDITDIYVCRESLTKYHLDKISLVIKNKVVSYLDISALLSKQDAILQF